MKELLRKFIIYGPRKFTHFAYIEVVQILYWNLIRNSYSQGREDLEIDKLLEYKRNGFYVDVGANDPNRFSNTKRFYKKGWNGINIEPNPQNYKIFKKIRKRDINLNIGVGEKKQTLTYYRFSAHAISTFSNTQAAKSQKEGFRLLETIKMLVLPLDRVLDEHLNGKPIDFLSIDTEGYDMIVLRSNDWQKYRPKIICIETAHFEEEEKNYLRKYMEENGYEKKFVSKLNSIYLDTKHEGVLQ